MNKIDWITIDCISSDGESEVIFAEFNDISDACRFVRAVYEFDKFLNIIVQYNGERQNTWQFLKEAENRSAIAQ